MNVQPHPDAHHVGYGSPMIAMEASREDLVDLAGLYVCTDVDALDFLAVVDVDPEGGGMRLDPEFCVDFSPARAHEVHRPTGDPTTEIFP